MEEQTKEKKHSRIQDTERKQVVWMPLGQQDMLRAIPLSGAEVLLPQSKKTSPMEA